MYPDVFKNNFTEFLSKNTSKSPVFAEKSENAQNASKKVIIIQA